MGLNLLFIDMLGHDIHLLHKNDSKFKTGLGLTLTLLNLCFVTFAAIYFGLDIVYLTKPITRISSIYLDKAEISLKDFPLMVEFFELTGKKIYDFEKYVTLGGSYFEINSDPNVKYYRLHWEPCDIDKHFSKYKNLILDGKISLNDTFCLDPYKATLQGSFPYDDIETVYKNLSFQNEHSSYNSKIISAQLYRCDEKRDKKKCSNDDRNVLKEFFARFAMVDHYIDLKSYEKPAQEFIMFYAQMITSDFYKRNFFKFQLTDIKTDSGFFFENDVNSLVHQYQSFRNDVAMPDTKFYELTLDVSRVESVNSRRYVKVQEILANVGGIFKFLFMTCQFILYFYTKLSFYFEISESFFYILPESTNKIINSTSLVNKNFNQSKVNFVTENKNSFVHKYIKKNSIKNTEVKIIHQKINLRFYEYLKLITFNRGDAKRREQYNICQNLVDSVLEVKNLVNLNLATNNLINLLMNDKAHKIIFKSKFDLFKFTEEDYLLGPSEEFDSNNINKIFQIYKKNFMKINGPDNIVTN